MGNGQYVVLKRIPTGGGSLSPGEIVDASNWRNAKSLVANGYIVPLADKSEDVLAEARTLRRGGPLAQKTLVKLGKRGADLADTPAPEPEPVAAEEEATEESDEDALLEQYHTGHGWYELPGHESKVRREEALLLLSESQPPGDDEE